MGNGKKKTRRCNVFCAAKGISSATFKFSDSNCEMVRAVVKRVYIYDFSICLYFQKDKSECGYSSYAKRTGRCYYIQVKTGYEW